jgi:prepilin-type N-terminal cleavage/methylation domain-containing protein
MHRTRRGFTLPELALTLTVIAILAALSIRGFATTIRRSKVDRAASVLAADMEQAFTIAGRLRRPVRISFRADSISYRVADATGGTVRLARVLGAQSEYGLTRITFDPVGRDTMTILPPGRASEPLRITIASGNRTRLVTVSSAGFVRVTN